MKLSFNGSNIIGNENVFSLHTHLFLLISFDCRILRSDVSSKNDFFS